MIKLFRSLRKDASTQKNVHLYFLYALGEVTLVVVGILVALQVDNWNNELEKREKEDEYLSEIKSNLQEDIENIESTIAFNIEKSETIIRIFRRMQVYGDGERLVREIEIAMDTLPNFKIFISTRIAFDNMLSSASIDIIEDDSLKSLLSRYYISADPTKGTQERVAMASRSFVDYLGPRLMSREFVQQLVGVDLPIRSTSEVKIAGDETFINNLFLMLQLMKNQDTDLVGYKKRAKELIGNIDQKIDD